MGEISIRQVDPAAERARILGVLAASLPAAAAPERFDWLYLSNPDGRALVWLAEHDDGTILGTSAAHPRRMRVGGDVVRALNLGDFAIDRSQRALGPALRLLRATLAPVHDGTYAFSYDFSNAAMHAVYRRMHVNSLGHDERWMQPVSMTRLARDKLSNPHPRRGGGSSGGCAVARPPRAPSPRQRPRRRPSRRRVWRRIRRARCAARPGRAVVGVRDAAYLNWRYLRNPVWSHDIVCARAGGRLGGLCGRAAHRAGHRRRSSTCRATPPTWRGRSSPAPSSVPRRRTRARCTSKCWRKARPPTWSARSASSGANPRPVRSSAGRPTPPTPARSTRRRTGGLIGGDRDV